MSFLKPTRENTPLAFGCLLFFTLFWNGIVFTLAAATMQGGGANLFVGLFLIPFVLIGLTLIAACGWLAISSIGKAINLGKAEVMLSREVVRPGEEFVLSYRQPFKRDVTVTSVVTQFILRETATYRRGTDTRTETNDRVIQEFQQFGQDFSGGDAFQAQHVLRVPADGMHTFAAPRNKVQWFVKIDMHLAGVPDASELFEVTVVPERMR